MRECPKCMSWWDGDTCPICEVPLMSEYSNNDGSDGVFAEPVPEPQPKFANIKKGDWVEVANGKLFSHIQVSALDNYKGDDIIVLTDDSEFYKDGTTVHPDNIIVRILSPEEVIVDFGSGIKGTVRSASESIYDAGIFYVELLCEIDMAVPLMTLDPETRAKVESLLKAQEEECQ